MYGEKKPENTDLKKAGVPTLISNEVDFRAGNCQRKRKALHKDKEVSSPRRHSIINMHSLADIVMHTCNPSIQEAEAELRVQDQPRPYESVSKKTKFKNKI